MDGLPADARDQRRVALERLALEFPRCSIPKAHSVVIAAAGDGRSIRRPGDAEYLRTQRRLMHKSGVQYICSWGGGGGGRHRVCVTFTNDAWRLCVHVPQPHARVTAASGELQAVGAELRARDGFGVTGQAAGAASHCGDAVDALRLKLNSHDAFAHKLLCAQHGAQFSRYLNAVYKELVRLFAGAAGELVQHKVHVPSRDGNGQVDWWAYLFAINAPLELGKYDNTSSFCGGRFNAPQVLHNSRSRMRGVLVQKCVVDGTLQRRLTVAVCGCEKQESMRRFVTQQQNITSPLPSRLSLQPPKLSQLRDGRLRLHNAAQCSRHC